MKKQNVISHFSQTAGSRVRRVYGPTGEFLGVIKKKTVGGYIVVRKDGKVREKPNLATAFKTIARAN